MRKCANISRYMRRPLLVIYYFAPDPSEFPFIKRRKSLFSFLSVWSSCRLILYTLFSFSHNTSYVELEPLYVVPSANITITFATDQENGVLLYVGKSNYVSFTLVCSTFRTCRYVRAQFCGKYQPVFLLKKYKQALEVEISYFYLLLHNIYVCMFVP